MDAVDVVLSEWARERPDLDASPVGIFGRLRRTSNLALRELERFLRDYDLGSGGFGLLCTLRRGGTPFRKTPSELAGSNLLTTGAITGRLDALESRGLITRVPDPQDRRVMYAQLTSEGLALIDQVFAAHLEREHRILSHLSITHQEHLAAGLAALERAIVTDMATEQELAPIEQAG